MDEITYSLHPVPHFSFLAESMANSSGFHLPNPFTPMAFLPPDQAYQKTITEYVIVGSLSVLIWDMLTHLHADYKLLTRYRITLPTIIYFLSRWSTLLYVIAVVVFQTTPVENCAAFSEVACAIYHVPVSSTALLFFLRVRAIFHRNRYITVGFSFLFLAVLGGSLTAVMSLPGKHIGNTRYCAYFEFKPSRTAANITLAAFDTCVFIAITWRLLNSQRSIKGVHPVTNGKFDILGRYLPAFSRALLQDGQKYYMVAMLANLVLLIMDFTPRFPVAYRAMFLTSAMGLTNIMACRVFRRTKMGRYEEDINVHTVDTIMFRKSGNMPAPIHTQMGSLTMSSATGGELHGSSVADTEAPSSDPSDQLTRLSKETTSVV